MLHLINYGMKNESKKAQYESVMNQKEGADGRVYGIVMEGTKYYIKSCPKGKENLTESFDYIGGFVNRKNCSYASYADAVKDMDMRLMSLNEDYGKRMPINEMKRSADFMDESMVEMQEELARYRQINENIDTIYQGGKGKISDKNTGVPEAPKTREFNTKVGDPFDDSANYEENRDNKENAKDHEKQGDPFKDEAEYKENTDNIQKKDSNTPGDTYTKKAEYIPDNAVAAMHPGGGKARVNEAYGDHHDPEWSEDAPEGPYDSKFDQAGDEMEEGLDAEENHFPEENPDLGAEEHGELGDPIDGIDSDDLGGGEEIPDDNLEADEFLNQFNDDMDDKLDDMSRPTDDGELPSIEDLRPSDGVSNPDFRNFDPNAIHLADKDEEIAGIDDMSGVDRNNLSADVIDNVVNEIVNKFSKSKKMSMISESVANKILSEMFDEVGKDGEEDVYRNNGKELWYDDEFDFGEPEPKKSPDEEYKAPVKGLGYFLGTKPASRRDNMLDGKPMDPRPGAPDEIYPDRIQYDPNDPHFLGYKYNLGQNDNPEEGFENSASWIATSDEARRFKSALNKAQNKLGFNAKIGKNINTIFRHGLDAAVRGMHTIARILGMRPLQILSFLSSKNSTGEKNSIKVKDEKTGEMVSSGYGYEDAKRLPMCIITRDGELPMSEAEGEEIFNHKETGWKIVGDWGIIGPSLKAAGFPDFTTRELLKLANECEQWDDAFHELIEGEEETMKKMTPVVQQLEELPGAIDCPAVHAVVEKWNTWIERLAGLLSITYMIEEVADKRSMVGKIGRGRKYKKISGGYEEYDRGSLFGGRKSLYEDTTVLHDFGNHPGYRKKPMTTPANTEVSLNGSRDWNDDSTKGEEPFGKKIGSGDPYDEIVDAVVKKVLGALNQGGQN